MWNRGGARSSALERAKAQLSGQRVTNRNSASMDQKTDVATYGKALQSRQMPLHGLNDLSSDAESEKNDFHAHPTKIVPELVEHFGTESESRFIKKSANKQSSSADTSEVKFIPQRDSQSLALSRLALIEDRIRNRVNNKLGLDPAADLTIQSSSELSSAEGSRFLKNKAYTSKSQNGSERPQVDIYMPSAQSAPCMQKDASVDSDEEDMRRLLGESFQSTDKVKSMRQTETQYAAKTYKKNSKEVVVPSPQQKGKQPIQSTFTAHHYESPSPSPPFSRTAGLTLSMSSAPDHSVIRSLEELFPITSNHDDTQSESSILSDDFKLNVMTLDDLAPAAFDIVGLSTEKTDTSPRKLSASSAIEILQRPEDEAVLYESDFESEIQTETSQSADDISKHLSGGNENSLVSSKPKSQSLSLYSKRTDDYAHSENPSKSTGACYSSTESSVSYSRSSNISSCSSVASLTHTNPQSPSVRPLKKDATVQTQGEGLTYMWSSDQAVLDPSVGMSYIDPTPVASHVISAEAVEALTSYSPAMFALNDTLRQQLTLTRSFIQYSRHLHQAMLESLLPADYRYTTLEDTKEFIRYNRPPKLTMEDALKEVLQEMKDYHYI